MALRQSDSVKRISLLAYEDARIATEQKNEALRLRMLSVGKAVSVKSCTVAGTERASGACLHFRLTYLTGKTTDRTMMQIYTTVFIMLPRQNGSSQYKSFVGHNGDVRSIAFVPGKNEFFTSGTDGKDT